MAALLFSQDAILPFQFALMNSNFVVLRLLRGIELRANFLIHVFEDREHFTTPFLHLARRGLNDRPNPFALSRCEIELFGDRAKLLTSELLRRARVRNRVHVARDDQTAGNASGDKYSQTSQTNEDGSHHAEVSLTSTVGSDNVATSSSKLFKTGFKFAATVTTAISPATPIARK